MALSRYTNFEEDIKDKYRSCRVGITVFASANGITVNNNNKCCAERRLLDHLEYEAKLNGQKGTKKAKWIRKQTSGVIKIWRYTADGQYGKVFPCSICRKSIQNLGLKVMCTMGPDEWFCGYMTEENKIHSKPTTAQRMLFRGENKFPVSSYYHI